MQTLQSVLNSFSQTLTDSRQPNGQTTPVPSTDGTQTASMPSGEPSPDTGTALIAVNPSSETGKALGRIGAIEKPRTAEDAAKLAEELVGTLLPPLMASWLDAQERKALTGMEVFPKVAEPEKTPDMVACISRTVAFLSDVTAPAKQRPGELAATLGKMFAGFNLFTGDAAKVAAQIEVWGEELQEYPMYAIRKAYKWAVRGGDKLPSLASFIADVQLAVGSNVLTRRRLLQKWLAQ